jgi:hypothetical protein
MPAQPPLVEDLHTTSSQSPTLPLPIDRCPLTETAKETTTAPDLSQRQTVPESSQQAKSPLPPEPPLLDQAPPPIPAEVHPSTQKARASLALIQAAIDGHLDLCAALKGSISILQSIPEIQAHQRLVGTPQGSHRLPLEFFQACQNDSPSSLQFVNDTDIAPHDDNKDEYVSRGAPREQGAESKGSKTVIEEASEAAATAKAVPPTELFPRQRDNGQEDMNQLLQLGGLKPDIMGKEGDDNKDEEQRSPQRTSQGK